MAQLIQFNVSAQAPAAALPHPAKPCYSQIRKKALGIGNTPSNPGSCMFIQDSSPLSTSSSGMTAKVRLCSMLNEGSMDMPGPVALPLNCGVVKREVLTTIMKGTCCGAARTWVSGVTLWPHLLACICTMRTAVPSCLPGLLLQAELKHAPQGHLQIPTGFSFNNAVY